MMVEITHEVINSYENKTHFYVELTDKFTISECLCCDLDFDSTDDENFLKIIKAEATGEKSDVSVVSVKETKKLEPLVDPEKVYFDKLQSFQNGIRILSLQDPEDMINEYDLFKVRIANPVRWYTS